jgi:hypothetical protein
VIYVFGSNSAGRHGKGSALVARRTYGAVYGVGEGLTGRAYAIPTKGYKLEVLSLEQISKSVEKFKAFARLTHNETFQVVKIGCGLAGYKEEQIKPMFADAPPNCMLPKGWRDVP